MRHALNPTRDPADPFPAAAAIRALIREAAGEADLLKEATATAGAASAALSHRSAELEAKLSRCERLIPIIEERLREVDTLLSASVASAARMADEAKRDLDGRLDAAIREHLRCRLLRDIQPRIERLIAARLDGFLTNLGALTIPEGRRAA